MKVGILGDFHFGYSRFYEDSFVQAERALLSAEREADVILVAGDIFDTRVPKPEVLARAIEIFKRISKPIVVIHGTHERRPKGYVNPVEILSCALDNVINAHGRNVEIDINGEKLSVYGMGGVPEEFARVAIEKLDPKPREGSFNIFMFHQNLKEIMKVVEHGLFLSDLPEGFDLYIDGHLHKYYHIEATDRELIIPGSTVVTQIRKEEVKKGYVIYDTLSRSHEFIEIDTREFLVMNFNNRDDLIKGLSHADLINHPIVLVELSFKPDDELLHRLKVYEEQCYLYVNYKDTSDSSIINEVGSLLPDNLSLNEQGVNILKSKLKELGLSLKDFDALVEASEDDSEFIDVFNKGVE